MPPDSLPESLRRLRALGQSVWLDFIRRDHLASGEFERLVRERGVTGVTSNPTLFHQAITGTDAYDPAIRRAVVRGLGGPAMFDELALEDIRTACDLLRPVYDRSGAIDGRVSVEVSPRLAHDAAATVAEARRLQREVQRPNLMVKIPATRAGVEAVAAALADGISVNVTLIFSLERYQQVMDAYLDGIERRLAQGSPVDALGSVASFFVSRVDTKIDAAIDAAWAGLPEDDARRAELERHRGHAAVANARLAYARFREVFTAPRFAALRDKGARVQRPLWASTGTKNPAYRDVLYVEELIGPDTVNTMPPATLEAFADHGEVRGDTVRDGVGKAQRLLEKLSAAGIDYDDVVETLEDEGVRKFTDSFDELIDGIRAKRGELAAA